VVKKMITVLLAILLLLPAASLAGEAVVDDCALFTEEEIARMEELIKEIRDTYQMDAAILTSREVPKNASYSSMERTQDFADTYYEEHGYGMEPDDSGVLYLIDMRNRVQCISTSGTMIDYITDHRREALLDAAGEGLSRSRYGKAAIAFLEKLEVFLRQGIEEGAFRYDEITGKRLSGLYNKLTTPEMLLGAACGAGVMLLIVLLVSAKYKLKRETYHFDKETKSFVTLTKDEQTFTHQSVSHRTVSSSSGGGGSRSGGGHSSGRGSSVHYSSSGRSHGGGGRHF